jgi:calcineurin-like phosphoesterase family protein
MGRLMGGALALRLPSQARAESIRYPRFKLGLIADVHQDIIHDAPQRLRRFVEWAEAQQCDGILQLGDFCIPKPENRAFLAIWNSHAGPRFHVLGNHDMDGGYTREQAVGYLGMPHRYYAVDWMGWRLIMLDANDRPPDHGGGYPSFIAPDQVEWLEEELRRTSLPVLIFSHQSLERPACIRSQVEVRRVISAAKAPDGHRKVAACFNGHWHIDHARITDEIPYVHINSAAYYWMGDAYARRRFSDELHAKRPILDRVAPYEGPLFTSLEFDPQTGVLRLTGRKSRWVGPSPVEVGLDPEERGCESAWITPAIRPREFSISSNH